MLHGILQFCYKTCNITIVSRSDLILLIGGYSPLEGIEPPQDVFFIFPINQFFYFRIIYKKRLSILDELFLHLFSMGQIQLQINRCGLDIIMPEAVFDI
jgi:hypothetical protein